jgi:hypothetical protein
MFGSLNVSYNSWYIVSAMFRSLISFQKYIEAHFFQRDNPRSFILDSVHVLEACVSKGLMSTLYINILMFLEVECYLRCFLSPWKHLFAARIGFWMSALLSLLQLTSVPK